LEHAVEARQLEKRFTRKRSIRELLLHPFRKAEVVEALQGVDLTIREGEIFGLLGPNGAGKTTSFSMIVGGIRPTRGRVFVGEQELTDLPMYQRARLGVVYLPQEPSIFRKLSVADNIGAILETVEPDPGLRKERMGELLAELGLADKAKQRADSLSGGERRRVEITRALVLDPRFLLLDEPFTGIDPIAVIDIQKIIEQLKLRGIGIVITEHKVRETLAVCDRAYIIQNGEIIRHGSPEEIASDPTVREIYLGENFELP
jgi:lipopolysaccharide export system ATP-binding protein